MAVCDPTTILVDWLQPFAGLLIRPTWRHVLVLVAGGIVAPHRRTVSAALRATGREQTANFAPVSCRAQSEPMVCLGHSARATSDTGS